jgi:hypothetical protein
LFDAPGVRSGTGVVEDVLYRQMRQLAARLHTLIIEQEAAAIAVVDLARSLTRDEWEQLQVIASISLHMTSTTEQRQAVPYARNGCILGGLKTLG